MSATTSRHSSAASTRRHSSRTAARASLVPFALTMVGLTVVQHAIIAATGSRIGLFAALSTAAIALVYAGYLLRFARPLAQVRFGLLAVHALVFAVVNTGFHLHAFILVASGSPAIAGSPHAPLGAGWFGATLGMAAFWGLGLGCHALGAIASRGFESGARA